jgi:Tfp pilus assembly protein PilW
MKKRNYQIINILNSKSGSSLFELMVVVFIFTLMMGGLYTTSLAGQDSWATNTVRVELQQDLRKSMERIKSDLRQAGGSSIDDVDPDSNPESDISFKIPEGITSGSIDWDDDTIVFAQNATDSTLLERTIGGGTPQIIATNIKSITFTRQVSTPNIVEIYIEVEKDTVKGRTITLSLGFQVQLRNT